MATDLEIERCLKNHLVGFFEGHKVDFFDWSTAPLSSRVRDFRMARVGPGPRTPLWTFVSLGGWQADPEHGMLEFAILSPIDEPRFLELLAMTVHYHCSERLGVGHSFPVGESWVSGSSCTNVLVSKPYPLGPEFEVCNVGNSHIHLLWLLPITQSERDFKMAHDYEALEAKFDEARLEYWKFDRSSVV